MLTPEYIYATRGGGMPDDEWFAVLWTDAQALAAAFNMEGAFNSVLLRLQRGASSEAAAEALDRLLEPYGGFGALGREARRLHQWIERRRRVAGMTFEQVRVAQQKFDIYFTRAAAGAPLPASLP